jgi:hypothetical protein
MVSKLSNVLKQFGTYDETFKDLPDPGGFFREPKMISTLFYRYKDDDDVASIPFNDADIYSLTLDDLKFNMDVLNGLKKKLKVSGDIEGANISKGKQINTGENVLELTIEFEK